MNILKYLGFIIATFVVSYVKPLRFSLNQAKLVRSKFRLNEQLGLVTMYFKESCPYCKNSKEILVSKYGLNVTFVDIEGENK